MIDWVASLPKPIGLFACNDTRGRQALRAVQLAGCASPEDVAVLGVDNDEVICELASPSMSSIEPDTHRMGFEAAERLEEMMAGKTLPSEFTLIPPVRVITRQSTDLLAVEDPEVAKAIQHIRERALSGLSVAELSKHLAISRVTLERRFRESLNRSPREEIERVRLGHVRILLVEANYSLKKIAQLTGYQTDSYLATVFRRREGCSPGEYRKTMQHSSR